MHQNSFKEGTCAGCIFGVPSSMSKGRYLGRACILVGYSDVSTDVIVANGVGGITHRRVL